MTRQDALLASIQQWEWMAKETINQHKKVTPLDYWSHIDVLNPIDGSYLCEYDWRFDADCTHCASPTWANIAKEKRMFIVCRENNTPSEKWSRTMNWQEAAEAAEEVVAFLEKELEMLERDDT